ncbi:MAG: hypothetical protein KatS3mg031_0761 [Chitinophagales bacterium]|nr:MAG: hypothetical protein KatS3mg031_0761 [Chitinophagales bacterium]
MQCSLQRTMHTDIRNILTYTPQGVSTLSEEQIKSTYLRGYHLYKATCSSCHGLSSTGKDTIPAFTFNQLDNYKTSATRGDPDNHAVTKKLSPEQLSDILTFLYFKTLARHAENMKKQD